MAEACILNGAELSADTLPRRHPSNEAEAAALAFCREWFSPSQNTITLHTSGSTGTPKTILASKAAMRESARRSCEALGLHRGDTAVLPLPLDYIAGKMMMVRALTAGLNLHVVQPISDILEQLDTLVAPGCCPDFMPVVPMQIKRALTHPQAPALLSRVRCLLIGGGFVDSTIEAALADIPTRAYVSYGMTETLSHIALRRLNGDGRDPYYTPQAGVYTPLPGVHVSLSRQGTLELNIPHLGIDHLCTHDLAELLPHGRFRILGRLDNVINSGGIKIQAEAIERHLRQATGLELIIIGTPHPLLGECVTALWQAQDIPAERQAIQAAAATLSPYERPRRLLPLADLPRTVSGKIARAACRELASRTLGEQNTPDSKQPVTPQEA